MLNFQHLAIKKLKRDLNYLRCKMVHTNHFCLISDTGKGVLYTSDADGIVFSESLRDHVVSLICFLWR